MQAIYDIFKYWTITVTISNKTFPKWTYSKICVSVSIIFCDNLKLIFWICGLSFTVSSGNNDQSVVISHPRWCHRVLFYSDMVKVMRRFSLRKISKPNFLGPFSDWRIFHFGWLWVSEFCSRSGNYSKITFFSKISVPFFDRAPNSWRDRF